MDIDMECSSVNMGRKNNNKKTPPKTRFFLDGARVYLGENITTKSLNKEHFMFSDESKFILS